MTVHEFIGVYFHQCLKKGLVVMKKNFDSGKSGLNEDEYNELHESYQNMLLGGNEIYYYRAKLVTETQHRSLTMRMNKALYQHYKNDQLCGVSALAIQLKKDDNRPIFLP